MILFSLNCSNKKYCDKSKFPPDINGKNRKDPFRRLKIGCKIDFFSDCLLEAISR